MTKKTTRANAAKTSRKTGAKARTTNTQPIEDLVGYHLRLAATALRRSFARHVAEGGVRAGVATLLQLIAANPGASQTEISRAMHVDKASLVSMLDGAEEEGWLKRERSTQDRRRHELRLTPAGKKLAADLRKQTLQMEKRYTNRFSSAELTQLVDYLKRIYD